MVFQNREHAARLLLEKLRPYKGKQTLILAIPRGAVPMGQFIARNLQCNLDVVLVRKISAPGNPEFAIGSVTEFGGLYLSSAKDFYKISDEYIKNEVQQQLETIKKRRTYYSTALSNREKSSPTPVRGKTIIIVDDGIATGATMLGAIRSVRAQNAKKIIVAAPVISEEAALLLSKESDELIVLHTPANFGAISQFYNEFPQVSDEQVRQILNSMQSVAA